MKRKKVYLEKRLFWHYCLQLSLVHKIISQILFNLFCSSPLENEGDFRDIMNVSRSILAKNQNFEKMIHGFVDEEALVTITFTFSGYWKTLVRFCLRKKIPENAYLTLIVYYRKIVQQNKLCSPKQK